MAPARHEDGSLRFDWLSHCSFLISESRKRERAVGERRKAWPMPEMFLGLCRSCEGSRFVLFPPLLLKIDQLFLLTPGFALDKSPSDV